MAIIHEKNREVICKLVYHGTGMCGKTTSLMYLNQHLPESQRGRFISLETPTERTLYFDFLPVITEARGYRFRYLLFTTPGQEYYEATRKLILKGADGIVTVVDSQTSRTQDNIAAISLLERNMDDMKQPPELLPAVLQYNKRDLPSIVPMDEAERRFNPRGIPSFPAVARTGQGVYETFLMIARLSLAKLTKPDGEAKMGPLFRSTYITVSDHLKFESQLDRLNRESGAMGALLVDESSGVLARCGNIPSSDYESLGALLACNFTAAQELAYNLSRGSFSGVMQKGPDWTMFAARVDQRRFMVIFCPPEPDRLRLRQGIFTVKNTLAASLAAVDKASPGHLAQFGEAFTSASRFAVTGLART